MWRCAFLLAAALTSAACSSPGWSVGEEGVARLAYADGWRSCDSDCALDVPLARGATAFLWLLDEPTISGAALRSEDRSVVEVEPAIPGDHFRVHGRGVGVTRIELTDHGGDVVDRFSIEVRDVDEVRRVGDADEPLPLTTLVRSLRFSLHGQGVALRGFGALSYASSGNVSVDPHDLGSREARLMMTSGAGSAERLSSERVDVSGDMSGAEGYLQGVAASGASLTVRFDVVAPEVRAIGLTEVEGENARNVRAHFVPDDAGAGLLACCRWSLAPSDAQLYLTRQECRTVRVASTMSSEPQSGTVTCVSYGAEASIDVTVHDLSP